MAMADFESSAAFSAAERTALRLADHMSDTPADVPKEVTEDVVAHYGEEALVALASVIAREQYRARFNRALGIGSDGLSQGQYCPLPLRP